MMLAPVDLDITHTANILIIHMVIIAQATTRAGIDLNKPIRGEDPTALAFRSIYYWAAALGHGGVTLAFHSDFSNTFN